MDLGEIELLRSLPREELLTGGHGGMAGYGGAIALRQALKALGPRTILCIPASSLATAVALDLRTALKVPQIHCLFESSAVIASGIKAALEMKGKDDVTVVSWAGDAGTADIGFQSVSGAAERNDDIIHVCYDDEAYLNTSGQAGGLTPKMATTVDTPWGKETPKKDMISIMAGHGVPYVASASIAYPGDLIRKVRRAKELKGFRYIHVLAPQPQGWGYPPDQTIRMARMAVETGLWPLVEVVGGVRVLTYRPERRIPVRDYIRAQRRFDRMSDEEIEELQEAVDRAWR
ncbi:MAG: thiamine pyrophosphate-dependent enzyme [Sphingomonadaceae bacterium]